MVCSTILLGSCGTPKPSTHEHTFDTVYKYDDKVHYFECTDPNCNERTGVENHYYMNETHKCKCGRVQDISGYSNKYKTFSYKRDVYEGTKYFDGMSVNHLLSNATTFTEYNSDALNLSEYVYYDTKEKKDVVFGQTSIAIKVSIVHFNFVSIDSYYAIPSDYFYTSKLNDSHIGKTFNEMKNSMFVNYNLTPYFSINEEKYRGIAESTLDNPYVLTSSNKKAPNLKGLSLGSDTLVEYVNDCYITYDNVFFKFEALTNKSSTSVVEILGGTSKDDYILNSESKNDFTSFLDYFDYNTYKAKIDGLNERGYVKSSYEIKNLEIYKMYNVEYGTDKGQTNLANTTEGEGESLKYYYESAPYYDK